MSLEPCVHIGGEFLNSQRVTVLGTSVCSGRPRGEVGPQLDNRAHLLVVVRGPARFSLHMRSQKRKHGIDQRRDLPSGAAMAEALVHRRVFGPAVIEA